jgi:YVTN family beta-propeller protein
VAWSIIDTITVGTDPYGVAYNAGYFAVTTSSSIYVIEETTLTVSQTITLPAGTAGGPIAYGDGYFVMVNEAPNAVDVLVYDASTWALVQTISGMAPNAIAYGNGYFMVTNTSATDVSVIDAGTLAITETITVPTNPYYVAYGNGYFMVSNNASPGSVYVIDESTWAVTETITVGNSPQGVAYGNGYFVVANEGANTVSVIDESSWTVTNTITVGASPELITYGVGYFVTSNLGANTLSVIDESSWTVVDTITGLDEPLGAAYASTLFLVANYKNATVSVVQAASAPNAPTLTSPTNGQYVDATNGVSFAAQYNSTDGSNANARAMRLKLATASAYSYYSTSAGAFQSTIVWNPVNIAPGASAQFGPIDSLTNQGATNWSMADQEATANLQGPFASDNTVNLQASPTFSINSPVGSETGSSAPPLLYTASPTSGATITGGQWVVYPLSVTQASGFSIDLASGTVPSGYVSNVTWNNNPLTVQMQSGVTLKEGQQYVSYAAVTETGTEWSGTVSAQFTLNLDVPAVPTIDAVLSTASTGYPVITLTVQGHDNILSQVDASFETGIGGWYAVNADLAQGTTGVRDGAYSLAVQGIATGAASAQPNGNGAVAGQGYTALAYWTASSSASDAALNIVWLDSAGNSISQASGIVSPPSSSGVQLVTVGTAPSGAVQARPQLYISSIITPQISPPASPAVTSEGTTGSTTYDYQIAATTSYGTTTASPTGSTTTGNATLDSTNYNLVAWTAVPLPAGSSGNLVYDSYLSQAIATVGPTWNANGNTIGTANGDWNVLNAGTDQAEWVVYGTDSSQGGYVYCSYFSVAPGNTYMLSGVLDASKATSGELKLGAGPPGFDTGPNVVQAFGSSGLVSVEYTISSSSTTQIGVFLELSSLIAPAGDTVSFSQIQLTQTSSVQPYEPGPLWTYPVYRANALIGSTTALAFEDTGQTAGSAAPTANTTGETHYLDTVGIFPGSTDNLVYDSNLTQAIASVGATWSALDTPGSTPSPATIGTAAGDMNVLNVGTDQAEWVVYGALSDSTGLQSVSQSLPVNPGSTYTVSCYGDVTALTAGYLRLGLVHGTDLSVETSVSQNYGTKGVVSVTYTVPSTGVNNLVVQVVLVSATMGSGDTVTWSQIQVTQTSTVQQYEPGPYWTAGGFAGSEEIVITRSDGLYLRGASLANPLSLPAPSQQVVISDYEVIPQIAYTYSATSSVTFSSSGKVTSGSGTASQPLTLTTTNWWEVDPTNPPSATNAQMVIWQPVNTEQSTAHPVTGQYVLNMVADTMLHQDFAATAKTFTHTIYVNFQALLTSQKTIFIQSPWGTTDSGYFRIGPQTGGLSSGVGNKAKQTNLHASTSAAPYRSVQITAIAQNRPPV